MAILCDKNTKLLVQGTIVPLAHENSNQLNGFAIYFQTTSIVATGERVKELCGSVLSGR